VKLIRESDFYIYFLLLCKIVIKNNRQKTEKEKELT